jgi:hypothetical protein
MMLNSKQREWLAHILPELGNVAVGSLVFGFVLRSDKFNGLLLMIGLDIAAVSFFFSAKSDNSFQIFEWGSVHTLNIFLLGVLVMVLVMGTIGVISQRKHAR